MERGISQMGNFYKACMFLGRLMDLPMDSRKKNLPVEQSPARKAASIKVDAPIDPSMQPMDFLKFNILPIALRLPLIVICHLGWLINDIPCLPLNSSPDPKLLGQQKPSLS